MGFEEFDSLVPSLIIFVQIWAQSNHAMNNDIAILSFDIFYMQKALKSKFYIGVEVIVCGSGMRQIIVK